ALSLPDAAFSACPARADRALTITCHAHPALDQAALDGMRDCVDPLVLAAVWPAEFPFLLRSGQSSYYRGPVDGRSADIFLAGKRAAVFSDPVHHRSCRSSGKRTAPDRWHGIYVRSKHSAANSLAKPVSCSDAAVAAVGDMALGIRPARMEISDAHCMDRGSDQLLLAPAIRCELGPRPFLPRTARSSRLCLSPGLPDHRSSRGLQSDSPLPCLDRAALAR